MKANNPRWLRRTWPILLVLVLVITISYIGPESLPINTELGSGKYELETVLEDQSSVLRGPVYFEYSEKQNSPAETRVFKLHFVHPIVAEGPGLGFMIPLSGTHEIIDQGKYAVDVRSRGAMENFETVFGYADLGGKTPDVYFTESGSISILASDPGEVFGVMDLVLDDGNGASIKVKGDFKAQPLPSNLSK